MEKRDQHQHNYFDLANSQNSYQHGDFYEHTKTMFNNNHNQNYQQSQMFLHQQQFHGNPMHFSNISPNSQHQQQQHCNTNQAAQMMIYENLMKKNAAAVAVAAAAAAAAYNSSQSQHATSTYN
jgi:hypothetical protein